MIKWEYKTITNSFSMDDYTLNELGEDGWELVSTTACIQDQTYYTATFKRALPSKAFESCNE